MARMRRAWIEGWTGRRLFVALAAAAGLVLIAVTFSLNAVAMYVRYHARKRVKW